MYTRSQTRSIVSIQRAWRRFKASRRCCPISLCTIPSGRAVSVGRQVYDAQYLAKYIETRGDYRCPITRSPIAPHLLNRIEMITGIPVLRDRVRLSGEGRRQRERAELLSYYSNAVDAHIGTVMLALLDENRSPREVMSAVVDALRSATGVLIQYTIVDRQRALTAMQAAETSIENLVCFHTFSQNLAVRFLQRFRQDARARTAATPPAATPAQGRPSSSP